MTVLVQLRRFFSAAVLVFICITIFGIYFLCNVSRFVTQGIDLVGGTLITLQVDVDKMYEQALQSDAHLLLSHWRESASAFPIARKLEKQEVFFSFEDVEKARQAHESTASLGLGNVLTLNEQTITLGLDSTRKQGLIQEAVKGNIEALRNRLDPFGAGEILIAPQGSKIVIELPNVQDPEQARALIGKAAHLVMKPVIASAPSKEKLLAPYGDVLPEETVVCAGEEGNVWYLLPAEDELTGRSLEDARLGYDPQNGNRPVVQFKFNKIGRAKFQQLTRDTVGGQLAVVLDDIVISAPSVSQEINSSEAVIQGKFTATEAQELATLLKSGSFIAPVQFLEERIIGPSLGWQAIKQGLVACAVGLLLVFIASIVIYKTAGLIAFLVLLYNLLFSLIGMWVIGATLTLPGIAGLILTVGMAVDASILIYERIKEEIKAGKSFKTAVEIGFSGAMNVIVDANVTHFLVALVLYKMGAGPLKGFAVTMIVGIFATVITGIFMLKGIFRYLINKAGVARISI